MNETAAILGSSKCLPAISRRRIYAIAFQWLSLAGLLLAALASPAQPLSNLVVTVGTTMQDPSLNHWSYVLLGAPQPQLLAGKRFAIYGKAGYPSNSMP